MRLVVCDRHRIFAESLSLVLGEAGYDVVAVTDSPDEMLAVLWRTPVDVCLLGAGCATASVLAGLARRRAVAPDLAVVLVSDDAEADIPVTATASGVRGVVHMDQHVGDIVDTIERVRAGQLVGLPGEPAGLAAGLTARERDVLCRLVRGADTEGVACALGVTTATARSHIRSILRKLGAHSRVQAAAAAVRRGLVDAETGDWLAP